GCNVLELEFE
ncbi:hypothetical protein D041_3897B, partial [Vibrio parahaemolyticus EKP-008]